MNPALLALVAQSTPQVIAFIKGIYAAHHPSDPLPTDAEIITTWRNALNVSLAKDDAFRAEG